jgi:hypothetical protein
MDTMPIFEETKGVQQLTEAKRRAAQGNKGVL